MGKFVLKDAFLSINGSDLSDHVQSVTLNYTGDLQESTAMGDGSRQRLSGLLDWSLDITFRQDFASGSVDDTLFDLVGGDPFPVIIRPTSAPVGPTNPSFSGNALIQTYPPIAGEVGVTANTTVNIQGNGTLTRATS